MNKLIRFAASLFVSLLVAGCAAGSGDGGSETAEARPAEEAAQESVEETEEREDEAVFEDAALLRERDEPKDQEVSQDSLSVDVTEKRERVYWEQSYIDFLKKPTVEERYTLDPMLLEYCLIDIDGNGIPELLCKDKGGKSEAWQVLVTTDGKEAGVIESVDSYNYEWIEKCYPGKNIYMVKRVPMGGRIYDVYDFKKLVGNKSEYIKEFTFFVNAEEWREMEEELPIEDRSPIEEYCIDGVEVSKEEYDSEWKKICGNEYDWYNVDSEYFKMLTLTELTALLRARMNRPEEDALKLIDKEPDSDEDSDESWKKAYLDYLDENPPESMDYEGAELTPKLTLAYIDDDDVPELCISWMLDGPFFERVILLTADGDEARKLMDRDDVVLCSSTRNGLFCLHMAGDGAKEEFYSIGRYILMPVLETDFDNGSGAWVIGDKSEYFSINGEETTKESFLDARRKTDSGYAVTLWDSEHWTGLGLGCRLEKMKEILNGSTSDSNEWRRAYRKYLGDECHFMNREQNHPDSVANFDSRFALCYIDDDDVPELVIYMGEKVSPSIILTFRNGILDVLGLDYANGFVSYSERKGLLTYCATGTDGYVEEKYYMLKNGRWRLISARTDYTYLFEGDGEANRDGGYGGKYGDRQFMTILDGEYVGDAGYFGSVEEIEKEAGQLTSILNAEDVPGIMNYGEIMARLE